MSLEKFEAYLNQELKQKRFLEDGIAMIAAIKDSKRMAREATAEKESALKEKQAVLEEIKASKAALEKVKKDIADETQKAGVEAKAIIAQAKSEANAFLGKAVLDADNQRQDAFKAKADADAYVEAKKAEALDWEAKANAAKAAHDAYKAELAG